MNKSALATGRSGKGSDDAQQTPPHPGPVPFAPLEGDVRTILTTIAHLLTTANWASVLPSIVDAAEREPALDRARGELPPDADLSALTATLMGPLFYRRWFSREPVDPEFVETIVALVLKS